MPDWDIVRARYVTSAVTSSQYPPDKLAEASFVGRSNVGKSSLINSLCRNHRLARTSGEPGKTRTINFFAAQAKYPGDELPRKDFFLVDLPGYGFARAARAEKDAWARFLYQYITASPRLRVIYQLIDVRHDLQNNDRECHQWLAGLGRSLKVIFTKADKLSVTAARRQQEQLCRGLGLRLEETCLYSALTNKGRAELIADIVGLL
jgi:GTP-binding protein